MWVASKRVAFQVVAGVVALVACLVALVLVDPSSGSGSASLPLDGERAAIIAEGASGAVVTIASEGCGHASTGSGFVIDGWVITNRHLVAGAERVWVDGIASRSRASVSTGTSDGVDLAVFPAEEVYGSAVGSSGRQAGSSLGPSAVGLALADTDAPEGTDVVMVGRADGRLRWLRGRVHLYTRVALTGQREP